jgi:nucleotide-binding universal stress UspA family protein
MATTIVVPLDGSPLAERALPYVRALARASGVRIVLVRAVLAHTLPGTDPTDAQAAAVQQAEDELAAVAERLWAEGLAAERHVYYGEASEAILETAHYQHGDLIAMSTHGRTGLGRWVYGSVADRVLQRTGVPLLLVPATTERPWPTDRPPRFLVPLDGSEFAEAALQPAGELAATLGAELVLLRVVEPIVPLVADGTVYANAFEVDEERATAGEYLERVAAPLRARGQRVTLQTEVGQPSVTIVETARERDVDLVVMATHGRGGLARVVPRSVATGTLQRAQTPLLLVRPRAAQQTEAASTVPSAEAADQRIAVTLSPRELGLVQQALAELVRRWEQEAGARVSAAPDGRAVADLLARLQQAEPVAAAAALRPGPSRR